MTHQAPSTDFLAAYAEKALVLARIEMIERGLEKVPDLPPERLLQAAGVGVTVSALRSGSRIDPGQLEAVLAWLWSQLALVRHLRGRGCLEEHYALLDQLEVELLGEQVEALKGLNERLRAG